jgi:ribosomal protein S18 acetylase RimI-like enzyme
VRELEKRDISALIPLRKEALVVDPRSFGASPDSDSGSDPAFLRALIDDPRQALFGAFSADGTLVGMVGVRCRTGKSLHRAHIWGMYVSPSARRGGAGRALLEAAVAFARQTEGVLQIHLEVSVGADAAETLYERAGFRTWGEEPRSMQVDGAFIGQRHMLLKLDGDQDG